MFIRLRQYLFFSFHFIRREKTANFFQFLLFSIYSYFIFLSFSFSHLSTNLKGSLQITFYKLAWILIFSLIISLIALNLLKVQRKVSDIGIMQAFGAKKIQVFWLIFFENTMLISASAVIGILLGIILLGNGEVFLKQGMHYSSNRIFLYFSLTFIFVNFLSLLSIAPAVYILASRDPFQSIRRGR